MIDTATRTVVATVPVAPEPLGIAVNPAGTFAYVVSRRNSSVFVISTATNTVVAEIPVGNVAQFIAFPTRTPIRTLIAQVRALADGGTLTQNQANGLIDKLNQIIAKLAAGQTSAACNQLSSFANQVNSLLNNGALTQAQAQSLITAANAIGASNGCQ